MTENKLSSKVNSDRDFFTECLGGILAIYKVNKLQLLEFSEKGHIAEYLKEYIWNMYNKSPYKDALISQIRQYTDFDNCILSDLDYDIPENSTVANLTHQIALAALYNKLYTQIYNYLKESC
jgi:hypothetical protein